MEIDIREYGSPDENNGAFSCACVEEKVGNAPEVPCPEPCPLQRECNWQKGLIALSASMAAVAIFAAGFSVRCRHELELERLRLMERAVLQVRLSSAESAAMEARRKADEAFSALIAAAQNSENKQE